jgi:glycosyltransferase involved in cell wall biosynthesis
MGSIWMPTFLYFFKTNFIWGPVGGGEGVPKSFLSSFPLNNRIIQNFRYFLRTTSIINPFIFFPSRKAKIIIARTNNTREYIPRPFRNKTQVFLETSIENEIFKHVKKISPSEKVELIFTGRLVPFKNLITLIKSLKYVEYDNYHLTIIGSGSEKKKLETELFKMDLLHRVTFVKEISRNEVIERLSKSDIYVFPSLREGGSWALMEAMAIGLPVICLKWSGMEIITDETSAIRISVTNPDQMIKDIAKAINKLIEKPTLRLKMGNAGRERIKNVFNWDVKGVFMEELLNELDKKEIKN